MINSQLSQYGRKFKLDDAGTVYGDSLYLQQLEFDYLKIDRGFIRRLGTPESKAALIQSCRGIVSDMAFAVIAEGERQCPGSNAVSVGIIPNRMRHYICCLTTLSYCLIYIGV
ncbi:MAG: EAL domain-containing protein [Shewanella sp.]|nr:EAL domain-containing protein [Shewanella sp.]MCF1429316.1 EAL domain-containing protein [Shewanella sp.]MCF1437764.1 EAL domain-containing protein [Shewanella sp.]MCF1456536.1 EAL domain-containing protein [Shewanella sp.]